MTRPKKRANMLVSSVEQFQDPSDTLESVIRKRAFELFEKRGKSHGHATEDWLRAEAEILAERRNKIPTESQPK